MFLIIYITNTILSLASAKKTHNRPSNKNKSLHYNTPAEDTSLISQYLLSREQLYTLVVFVITLYSLYFPLNYLYIGLFGKPKRRRNKSFDLSRLLPAVLNSLINHTMNAFEGINKSFGKKRFRKHHRTRKLEKYIKKNGGWVGGLTNYGNTCFMNSVLQSIASSEDFTNFLDSEVENNKENLDERPFTVNLTKLLTKLNSSHDKKTREYGTNSVSKSMEDGFSKGFLGYNQEDANEFFQKVLNSIEKEMKKTSISSSSASLSSSTSSSSENKPVIVELESTIDEANNVNNYSTGHYYIPANQIDPLVTEDHKAYRFNFVTPADGLSVERIGCLTCGETGGLRYSVTSGLSLSLPSDSTGRYNSILLEELLNQYIEKEIIDGVTCNRCSLIAALSKVKSLLSVSKDKNSPVIQQRVLEIEQELSKPIITDEAVEKLKPKDLNEKSQKSKQAFISKPSCLLSIHLNRSVFDYQTGYIRKNNCGIKFGTVLDLNPFVANYKSVNIDARKSMRKQDDLQLTINEELANNLEEDDHNNEDENMELEDDKKEDNDEEKSAETENISNQSLSNESKQKIEGLNNEIKEFYDPSLRYHLKAVIVHYGSHNYGHYIAYRKYRNVWWRISDEEVRITTEDEVLAISGVFMLFYERPHTDDDSPMNFGDDDEDDDEEDDDEDDDNDDEDDEEDDDDDDELPAASVAGSDTSSHQTPALDSANPSDLCDDESDDDDANPASEVFDGVDPNGLGDTEERLDSLGNTISVANNVQNEPQG